MAQQTINIGASPNDGTGTPLRTAFQSTNSNFTELYTALGGGVGLPGATTQVIFNDGGTNLAGDAGLVYNKTTDALTVGGLVTAGSATITGALTVGTTLGVTGVSTFAAGTALLPALTTTGDTNTGIYYPAADTFAVTTSGAERYRVDYNGNVGIGVTPSAWDTATSQRCIEFTAGYAWSFGSAVFQIGTNAYYNSSGQEIYKFSQFATFYRQRSDVGQHQWFTAPSGTAGNVATFTQAMTLDANGKLTVSGGGVALGASTSVSSGSNTVSDTGTTPHNLRTYNGVDANNATSRFLICDAAASVSRAEIRSNGGLANYQANNVNLSDIRTKTDIKPLTSYWNKIKALELVTFKYKDQTHNDDNIGLIAQQVESVAPELVDVDGFGETPADGVPLKTIYSTDLYHAVIKALQESMTRIEVLESKLPNL